MLFCSNRNFTLAKVPVIIDQTIARHIWIAAQKLDILAPFGAGPEATRAAIAHLGYVQIDTINVVERCHHHILFSRIPNYRRSDLAHVQSVDKSVLEYWTHALSYVPTENLRFFLPLMKAYRDKPSAWFGTVSKAEVSAMKKRLRSEGPLSMRDIDDDELVDKDHPWASRKPSKRVLQLMFYQGHVAIAAREGMLKTYDLIERHFGWDASPKAATERQVTAHLLDRALRSQGIVSLDSICHLNAPAKKAVKELIDARVKAKKLVPVVLAGAEKVPHWAEPQVLETVGSEAPNLVHILSPFDPLIIQRKRLKLFFGYDHIFEAYVPAAKRQMGYFALPVLLGDRIVAAVDLKTDRTAGKLLIQKWTALEDAGAQGHAAIEEALGRFERFQLGS
ncbi:MAG: crosslink repair DNA glycosylase YcaQ family protein [Candidatus Devosia phytovorans]|uniref:Crosslink repair DNA glycosylase YcaQ family protein n=1 Tax=Candidatus Devosia phytovorans TaxID=3121372 RepID=A0AAJ6AZF9_9HYPH|nr:crosslink repair DNA glycosylase YcaQ family protein [Devosia sp.]WEK04087.1 MAG: crosslink repair DNA glycosylase YcaQ family protein [Devosia sp.]